MGCSFDVQITELSSPEGTVSTYLYGLTEGGGYILFKQRNGWFYVRYMDGSELLPKKNGRDYIYYEFRNDFSLFDASPVELDNNTPDYIKIPNNYTKLPKEIDKSINAVWFGTRLERNIQDDSLNHSKIFRDFPTVSDTTWEKHRSWRAIVESVDEGWETETNAKKFVGDKYYNAFKNKGIKEAVKLLVEQDDSVV